MHHIKNTLPEIKAKISAGLIKYQQELQALGDPLGELDGSQVMPKSVLTEIIVQYHFKCYH
jgi:hypothetical protein